MPELTVPESTITVEVYCQECGGDLTATAHNNREEQWLEVEPCKRCLDEARKEAP